MKFRRRRAGAAREDVFINLASLIDVIFVLLLFFVVSTTFTRPEQLNIELHRRRAAKPPAPSRSNWNSRWMPRGTTP